MKNANRTTVLVLITATVAGNIWAQDWPQWRGPNRDAKVSGFNAPKTWPQKLTQKWKVTVGEGVATPALVGDKLFVFSRQEGNEITRCLDAATGKELWQEKYETGGVTGPAAPHSGPRSSPTIADGKVVTLGVRGMLSCLDAATGKKLWRKDDFRAYPQFHPASSPIIVDHLCIAQLGGREDGAIVAYDLATGDEKWKWHGPSPAYASPVLTTVGGTKLIVAQTEAKLVALEARDGKPAWEAASASPGGGRGGGRDYKAVTPIVDGQTIISAGRGIKAVKLEKEGDGFVAKELWSNPDESVLFNTPVLKSGLLYGLTQNNELFCINANNGQTAWTTPSPAGAAAGGGGGGRGGRGGGFGSIVDAGPVLLALTPSSELIVFEPSAKEYKQIASYKVSETPTHAHPVVSGNRVFIKDKDSVTLWTVE